MGVEIEQPNIEMLPRSHPEFPWVLPQVRSKWIRAVAPQFGIDADKLVRGYVLAVIIGDDINCFAWYGASNSFEAEQARKYRKRLLSRLDWEINTPETPVKIKEILKETQEEVEPLDWSNEGLFKEVMKIWCSAKESIEGEINRTPALKEAIAEYNRQVSGPLSEPWQRFYYGGMTVREVVAGQGRVS